jgi:hypothetical protein
MNSSNNLGPVFAKTIILGNYKTGRSFLIQNLEDCGPIRENEYEMQKQQHSLNHDNQFFSAIELTPQELESQNQSAVLKVWEYSEHLSKKDETMVFRGALFCIIVFNILDADSYQAVFDKWIPLKEKMSPDSFLYIVGTHSDQSPSRRLQLHDICKACAKKDAVYVEVSNLDGYNFPLLRKLLCKRVQFMISKRDALASRTFGNYSSSSHLTEDHHEENLNASSGGPINNSSASSRNKVSANFGNNNSSSNNMNIPTSSSNNKQPELSIPFLEPNIMCNSVGSILASYYGLETWEGFDQHETEIAKISQRIDQFIDKLSSSAENSSFLDLNNMTIGEELFHRDSQDLPLKSLNLNDNFDAFDQNSENIEQTLEELNETLKVLGLSIPNHLLPSSPSTNNNLNQPISGSSPHKTKPVTPPAVPSNQSAAANSASNYLPNRTNLRRMVIKLPQGQTGEILLDLESNVDQQIETFLVSHGMGHDNEARRKLLQSTLKMQRDYLETMNRNISERGMNNSNTPTRKTTSSNAFKRE